MIWRHYRIGPDPVRALPFYAPNLDAAFKLAWSRFGGFAESLTCYGSYV
jgi:hypothetical protein